MCEIVCLLGRGTNRTLVFILLLSGERLESALEVSKLRRLPVCVCVCNSVFLNQGRPSTPMRALYFSLKTLPGRFLVSRALPLGESALPEPEQQSQKLWEVRVYPE